MNPAIDRFAFKQSPARAAEIVEKGEGEYIFLANGRLAVQLFRDQADREHWLERLEKGTDGKAPMPYLKFIPPQDEAWLTTKRDSLIPNVRQFAQI